MCAKQHAFSNPKFYKVVELSKYFHPVVFPSLKNNINKPELMGLRTGKLFFNWSVFYQIPNNIDTVYLKKTDSTLQKDTFVEFRNMDCLSVDESIFTSNGYKIIDWYNIIVDVKSKEKLWQGLNESKRRQVRKSLENGARISIASNVDEVKAFYDILKEVYRTRVKKPLPDWSFFKAFYEENTEHEFGVYILVKYNGKVIAGMMCPITPNETLYEWYVAGLDKEFKGTGIYPSVLVTWGALEYAANNNIPKFNFMGAGQPKVPYGVRDFKLQFGGELVRTTRYRKVNKPLLYKLGQMYFRMREII